MKYCKICKVAAKDSETLCAKGHPLSIFGAQPVASPSMSPASGHAPRREPAAPGSKPSAVMFSLLGEVQKLEETKKKNVKRGWAFASISVAAILIIGLVLYQVYSRTVLSYAVLENIRVAQDKKFDRRIHIAYDVKTPGKVAYDRRSGNRRIEKLDLIDQTGERRFWWAWPSDPKTGIDFRVRYRDGWLLNSFDRHFNVTPGPGLAR
jgi:hypothetical protein